METYISNLPEDSAETKHKRVGLFLKQSVTSGGSSKLLLERLQRPVSFSIIVAEHESVSP
jgi:hypothetical protein